MLGRSVRLFSTTTLRAAESVQSIHHANAYGVTLSKVQGHVNGLTGGIPHSTMSKIQILISS